MTATLDALLAVKEAASRADQADQDLRAAVIAAVAAGVPQTTIAETAGINRATVRRWTA